MGLSEVVWKVRYILSKTLTYKLREVMPGRKAAPSARPSTHPDNKRLAAPDNLFQSRNRSSRKLVVGVKQMKLSYIQSDRNMEPLRARANGSPLASTRHSENGRRS